MRRRSSFLISKLPFQTEFSTQSTNHLLVSVFPSKPPPLLHDEWAAVPHLQGSTPTYSLFPENSLSLIILPSFTLACPPPPTLKQSGIQLYIHLPFLPELSNFPFIFQQWDSWGQMRHFLCQAWFNQTQCTQITWAWWWNTSQLSIQND